MRAKPAPDAIFARLAAAAHGVVTAAELLEAGVSRSAIDRARATGRLHRIHQGVYAVGHVALSREGRWMAAIRSAGFAAVLSHRSAAQLWGLLAPGRGPIHVTVPGRNGRVPRTGVTIHRPRHFDENEATSRDGIPVTSVPRTLNDLRRVEQRWLVRRAIRAAEVAGLPTGGIATDRTRSDLERAFLAICRRHQIPAPVVNARIGRFTVDFLWPDLALVIEVDGYRYHRGARAFRDDRDRDLELGQLGFTVHRFADTRIGDDPTGVARATSQLIAQRQRSGAAFARQSGESRPG